MEGKLNMEGIMYHVDGSWIYEINNYKKLFCWGGGKKTPTVTQPPPASPPPTITPSDVSPQGAEQTRRKRIEAMRFGLASTIKTSPSGVEGELVGQGGGKKKLGE